MFAGDCRRNNYYDKVRSGSSLSVRDNSSQEGERAEIEPSPSRAKRAGIHSQVYGVDKMQQPVDGGAWRNVTSSTEFCKRNQEMYHYDWSVMVFIPLATLVSPTGHVRDDRLRDYRPLILPEVQYETRWFYGPSNDFPARKCLSGGVGGCGGLCRAPNDRDERRTTQNSGICSPGSNGEMYYGQLQEILEFNLTYDLDMRPCILWSSTVVVATTSVSLIVPDEDDDIIDDEDALPHDLADSDDEDLVNVDDMSSADVCTVPTEGAVAGDNVPHHTQRPCLTSGRTWNPPAGQRSTKASTCTCKNPTIPTRLLSRHALKADTTARVTMWRRSGWARPGRLQRGKPQTLRSTFHSLSPSGEHTLLTGYSLRMRIAAYISDSKYSDMFKEFESGGASGSGGCGDDEEGGDDEDDDGEENMKFDAPKNIDALGGRPARPTLNPALRIGVFFLTTHAVVREPQSS
ncbi:hypothetical protein Tco_1016640 [Tanacetum coccineum]|uniref:Uncharacterized protein n=1 Tax=Tanacetum coccineum TaxID=301880 RepID=A0ABQ5FQE9_9ASTR